MNTFKIQKYLWGTFCLKQFHFTHDWKTICLYSLQKTRWIVPSLPFRLYNISKTIWPTTDSFLLICHKYDRNRSWSCLNTNRTKWLLQWKGQRMSSSTIRHSNPGRGSNILEIFSKSFAEIGFWKNLRPIDLPKFRFEKGPLIYQRGENGTLFRGTFSIPLVPWVPAHHLIFIYKLQSTAWASHPLVTPPNPRKLTNKTTKNVEGYSISWIIIKN